MYAKNKILLSVATIGTSTAIALSPFVANTAFAAPEETISSEENADTQNNISGNETELSEEELAAEYQAYLHSLEEKEDNPDTLTQEEEAAGYQIVDGVKRSPESLEGDFGSEVNFGGVTPSANTGYVNFFTQLPEYVHENAYVIVMNLNTGAMFGCRTYEINGFQAQICLPAGIYMISEGGLSSDSVGRFYALSQQFQVKSGSQQTIVAEIADTHPELAEQAYPESKPSEETVETAEETASNGATEKVITKSSDAETSFENPEEESKKENRGKLWKTVVLTIFFTVIPLTLFTIMYLLTRKQKRGFDD